MADLSDAAYFQDGVRDSEPLGDGMNSVTIPTDPSDDDIREMCRAHCRHEHHDPDADDGGQPLWKILEPAMRASYAALVANRLTSGT